MIPFGGEGGEGLVLVMSGAAKDANGVLCPDLGLGSWVFGYLLSDTFLSCLSFLFAQFFLCAIFHNFFFKRFIKINVSIQMIRWLGAREFQTDNKKIYLYGIGDHSA